MRRSLSEFRGYEDGSILQQVAERKKRLGHGGVADDEELRFGQVGFQVDVHRAAGGTFHDVLDDPFLGRTAARNRRKAHQPRHSIAERPEPFRHEDRLGATPSEPADQIPVRADDRLESGPP